jgi:hypothetical protein
MDDCLTLTVIIRGPAYRELISQLSAVADSRDRAGLLKRLAEDGTRVSGSPVAVMTGRAALSGETGSDVRGFDIRLVIRQEEFPRLHGELLQCVNPRARAAQFRQLAYEGARRRQVLVAPDVPQQRALPTRIGRKEAEAKSISGLALEPGSIPKDLFSGFGSG